MAESVNPLRPDGLLSRTGLSRVGESTSRQESIFGGMPRINVGAGESVVQGPADSFWIRIDAAGANGQYAATEVARQTGQAAGASDQPPGDARKWTLANNPASEVNLSTDVAVNSIHRAWNSGEQGVIEFDASGGGAAGCDACFAKLCVVRDPDTGFITNIYYMNSAGASTVVPDCILTPPVCTALVGGVPTVITPPTTLYLRISNVQGGGLPPECACYVSALRRIASTTIPLNFQLLPGGEIPVWYGVSISNPGCTPGTSAVWRYSFYLNECFELGWNGEVFDCPSSPGVWAPAASSFPQPIATVSYPPLHLQALGVQGLDMTIGVGCPDSSWNCGSTPTASVDMDITES